MKIYFFSGLGQGGAERQVVESANLLISKGHEVKIFTYNKDRIFYSLDPAVEIIDLKKNKRSRGVILGIQKVSAIFHLYNYILKLKPDFIISYITKINTILGFIGLLPLSKKHTKFIASERTSELRYEKSKLWLRLCNISYKGFDLIYSNNKEALRKVNDNLAIPVNKLHYLPNILRTDIYVSSPYKYVNENSNTIKILVPGRIDEKKNQKSLINIHEIMCGIISNFEFILAGNDESEYSMELKKQIEEKGIKNHFRIIGETKNMIELYNSCDYMLLPSRVEGMPNVLLEAMSCEMICIGSNIDSIQNIIRDDNNGFIIDIENQRSLRDKFNYIFNLGEDEKIAIKRNARKTAEDYSPETYYINFIKMLKKI